MSQPATSRRNFLAAIAAGGTAATAAVVPTVVTQKQPEAALATVAETKGCRETPHFQNYPCSTHV